MGRDSLFFIGLAHVDIGESNDQLHKWEVKFLIQCINFMASPGLHTVYLNKNLQAIFNSKAQKIFVF